MKRNILLYALLFFAGISTAIAQENIFSESFKKGIPVQITNNRDKGYAIKTRGPQEGYPMIAIDPGVPLESGSYIISTAIASGKSNYMENEIWYLVGNADGFKLFYHELGERFAVNIGNSQSGAAVTFDKPENATLLVLTPQADGSYAISPADNKGLSFNMFGGAGQNIKLYSSEDAGSHWNITPVDMTRPLTIDYETQTEGSFDTNTRVGDIDITVNGNRSSITLQEGFVSIPAAKHICYLPKGATFSIATGTTYHGWKLDINGGKEVAEQTLPENGMDVTVNITADKENKYQYLFYSPDEKGIPYRIPAIVTTANGYVFAINDYRPCGNDIGFGEVDLMMRHSTKGGSEWDGHSWSEPVKIADGVGKEAKETWLTGFGDPAVVADRERNEILVMSVCGNRVCWHGNYGAGTPDNPENPNRMARLRIKYNEETGEWEASQPKEVTYEIYPLFKDKNGKAHVGSMFIGAGRMAQSRMIKVGDYYRIYCAVWAVETASYRHHNYALYSDDFGETWHLLGELGNDFNDSPAPYGNEPKCEELPDGSVLLSSRKGHGRYFNVFHYTNFEKAEGYWDGAVATDEVGDLKFGSNDTNGEPLLVGNILFQSVPTGDSRSDVAIFYKPLSDDPATYTPTELSKGWKKIPVSDRGSAYSSMCILPDGNIGIYYEEEPGGYSMVYTPVNIETAVGKFTYTERLADKCDTCGEGKYEGIVTVE